MHLKNVCKPGGLFMGIACSVAILTASVSYSDVVYSDVANAVNVDIQSQNIGGALRMLAKNSGIQIVIPNEFGDRFQVAAVKGRYTVAEALDKLLAGTGLVYEFSADESVVIKQGAEDGSNKAVNDRKLELEEVIVTATKRSQSIQDIALSMAAVGSEEMDRKALEGFEDYIKFIPGVSLIERSVGQNSVLVRGVASDPQAELFTSGPSVGAYFGEVPIAGFGARGGTADIRLVDMQRVEILRGPQGTLFGSTALSGTVRNIPVAPNLAEFEAKIKTGYSNTARRGGDNYKFEGVINIPVIDDVLAFRAVAYRHETSGYIKNIAGSHPTYSIVPTLLGAPEAAMDQDDIGLATFTGGRLAMLWAPTENLNVTLQYIRQEVAQKGNPAVHPGTGSYTQTVQQFGSVASNTTGLLGPNAEVFASDGFIDELDIANAVIEYDLGWATLLSSSSWLDGLGALGEDQSGYAGGIPVTQMETKDNSVFAEELRLTSALNGPMQFLLGLYYEKLDKKTIGLHHFVGDPALVLNITGAPFGAENSLLNQVYEDIDQTQKALFGELSYDVTGQLALTVGMRWFDYEKSNARLRSGFLSGPTSTVFLATEEKGTNAKVNVSYQQTDDVLFYAQWAEGFRLGGTQDPAPTSLCDLDNDGILDGTGVAISDEFDSDKMENFELGGKATLLDARLQVNASVFRINWQGIPIRPISPTCFFGQVANAGEALSQGFDLQATFYATDKLHLNMGGSLTKAELTEDAPGLGNDGDRLPGSPEYNFNLGLQYEFTLASYDAYVRGDYFYVGGYYNNLQQTGIEAGDYSQVNLNAGILIDKVNIGLFVRNLTNADEFTWVDSAIPDGRAYQLRPRTVGVNMSYQF